METKVKVYGKAQNRIALGIVNAYLKINPDADLDNLTRAFPDAINPDCGSKQLFMTESDIKEHLENGEEWYASARGYFVKNDEWLIMPDGERVGFVSMWSKPSLERLIEQAQDYGIDAEESDEKRGTYRLEYLNGFKPAKEDTPVEGDEVSVFIKEMQEIMEEYNIDYVPIMDADKSDDEWSEDEDDDYIIKVASYDDMLDITYGDSVDEMLDDDGKEKMNELLEEIPEKIFPTSEELRETNRNGFVLLVTSNGLEYEDKY